MERAEALQCFEKVFGAKAEDLFTAAGRINVIGEHVDYCGGKVFPAALNLRCNVYGRKTGGKTILQLPCRFVSKGNSDDFPGTGNIHSAKTMHPVDLKICGMVRERFQKPQVFFRGPVRHNI